MAAILSRGRWVKSLNIPYSFHFSIDGEHYPGLQNLGLEVACTFHLNGKSKRLLFTLDMVCHHNLGQFFSCDYLAVLRMILSICLSICLSVTPHLPNVFFFFFKLCFHVLHNVRHKVSTIFMMLKMFSCTDLFSRPLCWSIYWWMMWFLCGFEYIAKITTGYISQQWLEFVFAVREMSGKSQGIYSANPVATLYSLWTLLRQLRIYCFKSWKSDICLFLLTLFVVVTDPVVITSNLLFQKLEIR